MFTKIRNRLTLLFSICMMLFLLLFIVTSYFLLSLAVYQDSKTMVQSVIAHEWEDHRGDIKRPPLHEQAEKDTEHNQHDEAFYYIVGRNGQVIDGHESFPELRAAILERVKGWNPRPGETRTEIFYIQNHKPVRLMLAGQMFDEKKSNIQTIYAGIDITQQHDALERIMVIQVAAAVVFLVLSSVLAYYMANRAMRPIMRSFARQREFVADASHELRTPLSVLHSSIEVVESEEEERLSEFSRQILHDAKDEVQMMTSLVGDLLTLARADSGVLEVNRQSFDLVDLSHQLARTFQPVLAQRNQSFTLHVPETLPVYADAERIKQLLYILLENAGKYTPDGGCITLEIGMERKGKEEHIRLAVQDTGIGIPPEQQARIFGRFYRIDKGRSRQMGGTGLGLAIAEWIVQAHGGTIHLQSTVGVGSTFTVLLPTTIDKAKRNEL
ncbi:phospho-acceptor domain-containing protein [Aneurinibacillus soli]|uniref:histidine kinase n=1 Tax=Aneurinibacillus soli TaxID=1500254 RepID=A0A0U5B2S4_9BACL|nr:ATP-binding protein [Aneurinibacillus soli]PYE62204.1 phospho-acceptor domain-containing protein [Aneurinibacillus soli]BAU28608.1 Sensor histidine kinase YycG [Aneurinibacillus soli]